MSRGTSWRSYLNRSTIGMKLLVRVSNTGMPRNLSYRPAWLASWNITEYLEVSTIPQQLVWYLLLSTQFTSISFHCNMLPLCASGGTSVCSFWYTLDDFNPISLAKSFMMTGDWHWRDTTEIKLEYLVKSSSHWHLLHEKKSREITRSRQFPNIIFTSFESINQSHTFLPQNIYVLFLTFRDIPRCQKCKNGN
jgi:hypothetical protein